MPTAVQSNLAFPTKITEPFHPAIARLDSGQALPGANLTQSAKRLYARFSRQQMAARSKGRQAFRAKLSTLAEALELNERTIRRAINQLKDTGLLQVVRTGRSSWFSLLPLPPKGEDVDNSSVPSSQCPLSSDKKSIPHKKDFQVPKHNGTEHVDKSIIEVISKRFAALGFRYYEKGRRGPVPTEKVVEKFGVSWVLSWVEKAEDCGNSLRNPGAWLKKRLEGSLHKRLNR